MRKNHPSSLMDLSVTMPTTYWRGNYGASCVQSTCLLKCSISREKCQQTLGQSWAVHW